MPVDLMLAEMHTRGMATRSREAFGWTGTGKIQPSNRIIHADPDCIRRERNPQTGEPAEARAATEQEAERGRACRRCNE